jgi:hypothetical protein
MKEGLPYRAFRMPEFKVVEVAHNPCLDWKCEKSERGSTEERAGEPFGCEGLFGRTGGY